ncbi:hypothetical protein MTsN2n6_39450 [Vibrio fortis]
MFENHLTRTKFLLVIQIITILVASFFLFILLSQSTQQYLVSSLILTIWAANLFATYGLFKKRLWALKWIAVLQFIQLIDIDTPNFSWALSSGIKLPISVNFDQITISVNILSIFVIWLCYTSGRLLRKK